MPEITSTKLSIDPDLLPRGPRSRVLDVGCGDGRHLRAAAERGCFTVGIDYDADALRATRERLTGVTVDLIVADAVRLPFRNGAFDAAICTETFEHLPDDVAAMREIARVLVERGTLLGAVPPHFTERLYWMLSPGYRTTPGGHVRIYTPRLMIDRLHASGLRVTGVRYAHFVDSLIWLRFCFTDFLRPTHAATDFEAAVLLAVAAERRTPRWRTRIRRALASSRFIAALDTLGALIWPKSMLFAAVKSRTLTRRPPEADYVGVAASPNAAAKMRSHDQ